MRAAVLKEYKEPLSIEEREYPQPDEEGAVVRLEACGICRSDWHAWQGDWETPTEQILGHEPVGEVIETGHEVENVCEGDEVAVPFNLADGNCPQCYSDRSHMCENRITPGFSPELQGAFAEQMHVPYADFNLANLPKNTSSEGMAGLGCRFMTAYHAIVHRVEAKVGDSLAVHGCGGIGLSIVHIADAMGLDVVAVDIKDGPLERARSLGATSTINASQCEDVSNEVHNITDGGADLSVDALGIAETCRNSILSLTPAGTHIQIGLTTQEEQGIVGVPIDLITSQELELVGSKGMQPTRYGELVSMVEEGRLDPTKVVSRTVGLEDVSNELDAMTNFENNGTAVVTEF